MAKSKFLRAALALLAILVLLGALGYAAPVLRQEHNTPAVLAGIARLTLSDAGIVRYDDDASYAYYITKSGACIAPLQALLGRDGWEFSQQMGSGYRFVQKNDADTARLVTARQFTRFYTLWKVPPADGR
ncbi:MAG: hypothetical protein PHO66_04755 [Eubacteriales bacterium]|nr:hypothetical protein [Eubacteriales bacterium]